MTMTPDKARERYASALRSTFVSRSEPEVGKTYDLVDEDAADSLIAALGDEIAELTGQNIDLEVWRASAVKRAEQAAAERDEARSELEAIHALASSVPGMDPQDHETAMSVAEAMRAVIVQQAGDLERLRCWKED